MIKRINNIIDKTHGMSDIIKNNDDISIVIKSSSSFVQLHNDLLSSKISVTFI